MAKVEKKDIDFDVKVTNSDEYNAYIKALCRLASHYISPVRVKFAERAYKMYGDPTVRKLVLAYGAECDELDDYRLRDFTFASKYGACTPESLNDWCLNKAKHYGEAIWFLFGIDDDEGGDKDDSGKGD